MNDLVNVGQTIEGHSVLVRPGEVAAVVTGTGSCLVVAGAFVSEVQGKWIDVAAAVGGGFAQAGADSDGRGWYVRAAAVTQIEAKDGACVLSLGPTMVELASDAATVAAALGLSVG